MHAVCTCWLQASVISRDLPGMPLAPSFWHRGILDNPRAAVLEILEETRECGHLCVRVCVCPHALYMRERERKGER